MFKALADPTRRDILRRLNAGPRSAGELAEGLDISKPSLSHHFNVLKAADLIRARRDGQSIIYQLNASVLEETVGLILDLVQGDGQENEASPEAQEAAQHVEP